MSTAATPAAARAAVTLALGPGTAEASRVRIRTGRWKSRIGQPCSLSHLISNQRFAPVENRLFELDTFFFG